MLREATRICLCFSQESRSRGRRGSHLPALLLKMYLTKATLVFKHSASPWNSCKEGLYQKILNLLSANENGFQRLVESSLLPTTLSILLPLPHLCTSGQHKGQRSPQENQTQDFISHLQQHPYLQPSSLSKSDRCCSICASLH